MLCAVAAAQLSGVATVLPSGTIPGNADIEWNSFEPGVIMLWVRPGEDIRAIVTQHRDRVDDLTQALEGPFDEIAVESGLDRFYRLSVRPGTVGAKVREYQSDPRIESAELISNEVSFP